MPKCELCNQENPLLELQAVKISDGAGMASDAFACTNCAAVYKEGVQRGLNEAIRLLGQYAKEVDYTSVVRGAIRKLERGFDDVLECSVTAEEPEAEGEIFYKIIRRLSSGEAVSLNLPRGSAYYRVYQNEFGRTLTVPSAIVYNDEARAKEIFSTHWKKFGEWCSRQRSRGGLPFGLELWEMRGVEPEDFTTRVDYRGRIMRMDRIQDEVELDLLLSKFEQGEKSMDMPNINSAPANSVVIKNARLVRRVAVDTKPQDLQ